MARPCRWCGRFYRDTDDLYKHENTHQQVDNLTASGQGADRSFPCDACIKSYGSQSALVRHKKSHHSQNQFACSKCEKRFNRLDSRTRHEKACTGTDWNVHESTINRQSHTGDDKQPQTKQNGADRSFPCQECNKSYESQSALLRHRHSQHSQSQFVCSKCEKLFNRLDNKARHELTCAGLNHVCGECHKRCSTAHGLRRHIQCHRKAPIKKTDQFENAMDVSPEITTPDTIRPRQYRCHRCSDVFDNRHNLYLHGMRHHYQTGGSLQSRPWGEDESTPWNRDDEGENIALRDVYEANAPLILEEHRPGPIQSIYNFPVNNDVSVDQLMRYADVIYEQQHGAFRINLTFGVILQNRETEQYRYFVPYDNNGVLERPFYISKRDDLRRLRLRLLNMDITNELLLIRPDTKWIPVLVTNVHFSVYNTLYPLGNGDLPNYLLSKDSLYPLVKSRQTGKFYDDNLCAFRCLALHKGHEIRCIEGPANQLYQQWLSFKESAEFRGVDYDEFPEFESFFNVNMEVYSLQEDGFALSIYKSRGQQDNTMYVNLHENHLSYIRKFNMYAQKYRCATCDRHFKQPSDLRRHERVCANQTKYVYPGGFHQTKDSIFDKLDQYGINVPITEHSFPWYICYDFEALLRKVNDQPTEFLQWTHQHVPVSVSVCSNVEGYTDPYCIIDGDQNTLVSSMVEYMKRIAEIVYELAVEKWGWVLELIDEKISDDAEETLSDVCLVEEPEDDTEGNETVREPRHPLQRIYGELEGYMTQVPVIGFNSAKYDLNLIKKCLAKLLNMHDESSKCNFVVKKNNSYMCIATEQLKFLDMSQYLAAGSSYVSFLKAYRVSEQKGYFPYEWFDHLHKLEDTSLPTHESFYSTLKDSNISVEEYQYCQKIWSDMGMTTFRDFLIWYNNLDVGPFVLAVERFQEFYFGKGIDVFKTAMSVPGIARQLLFQSAKRKNVSFALFDKNNADLYQTIRQNIVGGPSIIFTRHHQAEKTLIRGKKKCGSILGFDANALYLQSIGQPMPVGPFIRRLADNDFRPELRDKYMSAFYWLDWLSHSTGFRIQHKLNFGREIRVGKYLVDGYLPSQIPGGKSTIFQFHGCYWHGHLCDVTKSIRDEKWKASRQMKYAKTQEITESFKKRGCHVVEMWECQYRRYCRENPQIYAFINSMRPGFFQHHKGKITENIILEGVVKGDLFGMVEVDIAVPSQWPSYFEHPTMTPYEYFHEMSPLFCTTDIPFEVIGEHMQQHVEQYDLSRSPRRLLVGGMKAEQILLATPLLQWYLNHGLVVSKIYQVIEFQQERCFSEFVREVSDARREGDANPDTAIIADTNKVIGNSGYGSLIMDQTKHKSIRYTQGENDTCLKVNEPGFRKLECLDQEEQYYELEMAKKLIKLDLPIQLGYMILQYAKLRMLEFYFDFMDVYVDRSDFEYCEMDTDSAYMAISGQSLADVIKPDMREKYLRGIEGFCTDTPIEANAQNHWFPRTCCSKHAKYDKRTPGLFKLEYQGAEMIGLCSKTYIVRKEKKLGPSPARIASYKLLRRCLKKKVKRCPYKARIMNEYKFSSKGVSKRTVKAPMTKFRSVMKTTKAEAGSNRGFRVRNNAIFTYTQERRGFSYFYCKRRVLSDGIHTTPLDITLCPVPKTEVNDRDLIDMLANNFE